MRILVAILALLFVYVTEAGDVLVNGVSVGKFTSMTIDFTSDKTGMVVIKTVTPPALTIPIAAMPLPDTVELAISYPSKMALYNFIRDTKYPGTVIVDGVKIRSGVKALVNFKTQPDGSVRR